MHSDADARTDAGRVERLHERQHLLDVLLGHGQSALRLRAISAEVSVR